MTEKPFQECLDNMRTCWLKTWADSGACQRKLIDILWLLSEFMYVRIRRAKMKFHERPDDESLRERHKPLKKDWQIVCIIGSLCLRMSRYLAPDQMPQNVEMLSRFQTMYAVALGYLQRFDEATRRFNEAHALIVATLGPATGRNLSRIHIRRAEVHICRGNWLAEELKEKFETDLDVEKDQIRSVVVCLDDAWSALERAQIGMGPHKTTSSYWWYRLIASRLSCLASLAKLHRTLGNQPEFRSWDEFRSALAFRRRRDLAHYLLDLIRDGLMVAQDDVFRKLRLIDYVQQVDAMTEVDDEKLFGENGLLKGSAHKQLVDEVRRTLESPLPTLACCEKYRIRLQLIVALPLP